MSKVKRWWINVKWLLYSCHGIHQIIRAVEIWMVLVVRGHVRRYLRDAPLRQPSGGQFLCLPALAPPTNSSKMIIYYQYSWLMVFSYLNFTVPLKIEGYSSKTLSSLMSLYGLQQTHEWRMTMTPDHLGVVTPLTKVERIWNDNE